MSDHSGYDSGASYVRTRTKHETGGVAEGAGCNLATRSAPIPSGRRCCYWIASSLSSR